MKDRALLVVKLILLAGIIYWLIRTFDRSQWDALKDQPKQWSWLVLALLLVLAETILSFVRWRMLVKALSIPLRLAEAIRLGFIGYLFNLVSAGSVGGDIFKAVAVCRFRESKRPEAVASVLMDRVVGLVGLIIVACFSLELLGRDNLPTTLQLIRKGAWASAAICVAGMVAVVLFGKHLPIDWLKRIPWLGPAIHRMALAGLIFEGRAVLLINLTLLSVVVHLGLTYSMALISNALYVHPPSVGRHFQVIPPAVVAGALPITPGGLGVQEGAIDRLFKEFPDADAQYSGLIVAAMYRLMTFCVAGIGAIYYFAGIGKMSSLATTSNNLKDPTTNKTMSPS